MKQVKNSILILTILLGYEICLSQSSQNIDYNNFLISVKEKNPLALKAENNIEYGNAQLRAAKGGFDPQLDLALEKKLFNSINYYNYGVAELKQPLYTSQYLKMGYEYGQGIYLNPELSTPNIGVPYIGIEASLLQGLMFDKRRAEVIKAKYYSNYYYAEQKIQLNDICFVASNTYMDALYAKKINNVYNYFLTLANQRLKGISELSIIGEKPIMDTIEAAILLQGRLLDKQASEIEMLKRNNEILVLNSTTETISKLNLNITDSLDQLFFSTLKSIQQLLINESNNNPIITQYFAKQKVLETESRLKREMIKPKLDVSYNFLNNSNSAIITSLNTNNYKWGATFSFPIFLRKSRNEYKMTTLIAQNNEYETINKQNQLNYKRKYIIDALQITIGQIKNAEKSVVYTKILVEAEKLKFMNGESSLFLVNSRENKWLDSELKLAEYKLKYIKAYIELVYIDGNLKYEL